MVRLDEGRFPALELNNRRLSVKNSFCRKNGIYTRQRVLMGQSRPFSFGLEPRVCPECGGRGEDQRVLRSSLSLKGSNLVPYSLLMICGLRKKSGRTPYGIFERQACDESLLVHPTGYPTPLWDDEASSFFGAASPAFISHLKDEDVSTKYNDLIPAESSSLTEKPSEISDSQGSDSEYEMDQSRQKTHSFVNHYISDPTYYNSWRRQQKGVSRPPAYGYSQPEPLVEQESRPHPPPVPPLPPLLPRAPRPRSHSARARAPCSGLREAGLPPPPCCPPNPQPARHPLPAPQQSGLCRSGTYRGLLLFCLTHSSPSNNNRTLRTMYVTLTPPLRSEGNDTEPV
ncbi:hypothetical protein INR49_018075 [Caranx melampygus]|nr:hypothetical protein INR49_018075 [Caranx melampygus]